MVFEEKMISNGDPQEEEEEEEEEEMVDPLDTVRQKCEQTEHCVHAREKLESCESRVGSRSQTTEECTEELFDFLHARDHCTVEGLDETLLNMFCVYMGLCTFFHNCVTLGEMRWLTNSSVRSNDVTPPQLLDTTTHTGPRYACAVLRLLPV